MAPRIWVKSFEITNAKILRVLSFFATHIATTFDRPIKPARTCARRVQGVWRSRLGPAIISSPSRHPTRGPPSSHRATEPLGWTHKRNLAMTSKTCVRSRDFVHYLGCRPSGGMEGRST